MKSNHSLQPDKLNSFFSLVRGWRLIVFFILYFGFFLSYSQPRADLDQEYRKVEIEATRSERFLGIISDSYIYYDSLSKNINLYQEGDSQFRKCIQNTGIPDYGARDEIEFFYSNEQLAFCYTGNLYLLSDLEKGIENYRLPYSVDAKEVIDIYCHEEHIYLLTHVNSILQLLKLDKQNKSITEYKQIVVNGFNIASVVFQSNGISRVPFVSVDNTLKYYDNESEEWITLLSLETSWEFVEMVEYGDMHILATAANVNKTQYLQINTITNSCNNFSIDFNGSVNEVLVTGEKNDVLFVETLDDLYKGYRILTEYKFSVIDILLFTGYFVLLILMGYSFSKNANTAQDYFKVKKKIPWWAAGVSILATKLSAVTFLSLPVKAFATDWMYFWLPVGNILLAVFVVKYILPFYSNLNVTTSFEYLEKRFNISIRKLGAYTYILSEITKSGVVILIPSLVVSVVTGIDLLVCIFLIGIVVTIYTVLGGIEAVIWIDVVQVVVMVGGVVAAILIVGINLDVLNLNSLFKPVLYTYKVNILDLNRDLSRATLVVIALSWFGKIQDYVSNQAVVQKLITTKDIKNTRRSTWMACLLNIPVNLLFLVMGSALFLFYQSNPERMDPLLPMPDALFVDFITAEMPQGLVALVIAGVFAAAMSTLAGSMSSMSTTVIMNLIKGKHRQDREILKLAKLFTILFGVLATFSAVVVALFEIKSLYDLVFLVIGLFGGGLAGLFILGMFTQKGNSMGALVGFISSAAILFYVTQYTSLNLFLYGPIGIFSCVIIGYLVSLIGSHSQPPENNLTIHKR